MSGRPAEDSYAEVAANGFRSGQVEALMWMQSKINGHLGGASRSSCWTGTRTTGPWRRCWRSSRTASANFSRSNDFLGHLAEDTTRR